MLDVGLVASVRRLSPTTGEIWGPFEKRPNERPPNGVNRAAIRALKPQVKPYKVADEKGLYLLVTPAGGRLWKLKFRNGMGAEKKLSLGA